MIKEHKGFALFGLLFAIFLLTGALALFFLLKGDIAIFINQEISNPCLDKFFIHYTMLGMGVVFFFAVVLLGFYKMYYTFIGFIILIMNGLLTYLFKQLLFKGMPRPTKFLDTEQLRILENFDYHSMNSFPSGHTITAFAMFSLFTFVADKKLLSVLFFAMALFVGISRIYLLQHFFMDVYAGSILGFGCTLLIVYLGKKFSWEHRIKYLDRPYLKLR